MYKINTLNKIASIGTDKFDKSKYEVAENLANADAIMVRSSSMHEMDFEKELKAIARAGAGVNNIPLDKCAEAGIVVFNTPGANANAVKELVLLSLLISSRKVPNSMEWIKTLKGKGDDVTKLVEKGKSQFVGPEISGKTLGVIGLGAIGILVANAAVALGMKVYGYDPFLSVDGAWKLSKKVVHATSLKEIYQNSDYITIHVPCNNDTKGFINKEAIALMKSDVRILNFARGELVNSKDILEAISEKDVACYVTDFPTDEMIETEGVIAFPHLGASTPESEDNCAIMAADELIDFLENGNIRNSVNMPNASMPKTASPRICVIHKNVKAIIASITTTVSDV
ncbi:MAG: 3-phosphoglycerate dehydrogenase, partial [Oscillospiraceae bacterium]